MPQESHYLSCLGNKATCLFSKMQCNCNLDGLHLLGYFFFSSQEHMLFECIFSSKKQAVSKMFCLQNNKGVFFTKGTTEDVFMPVSCRCVLAVNKTNCCLIRVTPSECDSPRYSSLMHQVLKMCLMGCFHQFIYNFSKHFFLILPEDLQIDKITNIRHTFVLMQLFIFS